jgi:translation initiation factor IF-2
LSGMLAPEVRELPYGRAQVRQLFSITKVGTILGCYVMEGKMVRNAKARVRRETTVLGEGTLGSLKRFKDDAREVLAGLECGLTVDGVSGIQVGDIVEAYATEEVARTL